MKGFSEPVRQMRGYQNYSSVHFHVGGVERKSIVSSLKVTVDNIRYKDR
jgi:hypothetical protein